MVAEKADKAWGSRKEVEGDKVLGHTSRSVVVMEESPNASADCFRDGVLSLGVSRSGENEEAGSTSSSPGGCEVLAVSPGSSWSRSPEGGRSPSTLGVLVEESPGSSLGLFRDGVLCLGEEGMEVIAAPPGKGRSWRLRSLGSSSSGGFWLVSDPTAAWSGWNPSSSSSGSGSLSVPCPYWK